MNGAASPPLVVGNDRGARTTQQPVMDAYQRKLGSVRGRYDGGALGWGGRSRLRKH